jgi:predicted amidohydrolase
MIHTPQSSLGLPAILAKMRAGDILMHFHAHASGILDGSGTVLPEVRAAPQRGVLLGGGRIQQSRGDHLWARNAN